MKIMKTRPGVVLTEIAGEYILIAAKSLLKECPYVTQINESSAFLWKCLEKGCSQEALMLAVSEEYELDDEDETAEMIRRFVQQLQEMKFIIIKEGEADE